MLHTTLVGGDILERIREHATNAWINGKSHIRTANRSSYGPEDQLVGQLGEFALARFFGQEDSYFERRALIDLNPTEGDGGSDLIGYDVDVKTSLMRRSGDPLSYNLLVRPRERHEGNAYVLALVNAQSDSYKVTLVGYALDSELPEWPESAGIFEGAFALKARDLHDLVDLRSSLVV